MIWTKFDMHIKNIKKHAINPIVPSQKKKKKKNPIVRF